MSSGYSARATTFGTPKANQRGTIEVHSAELDMETRCLVLRNGSEGVVIEWRTQKDGAKAARDYSEILRRINETKSASSPGTCLVDVSFLHDKSLDPRIKPAHVINYKNARLEIRSAVVCALNELERV